MGACGITCDRHDYGPSGVIGKQLQCFWRALGVAGDSVAYILNIMSCQEMQLVWCDRLPVSKAIDNLISILLVHH
ncbi:hypothetical protein D3C85_1783780 [compost metagenome]